MHEAKSGIPLTLIEQMLSTIRQIVRDEIATIIDNEGLSEYQLDDRVYERSQEAVESFMSDNLDDRIQDWVDNNMHEYLEEKIRITIE